jgi:hypothetical protein
VGLATLNQGDIIYVMPGHNETIINNTALAMDKAGISVIGLGKGNLRPILDFDNTAGSIIISEANCRLSNLVFNASVSAVVLAIDVNAHDFELDNCYFTWEATGDEFISMVDVTAFDRTYIHDNVFETEGTAADAVNCISLNDAEDVIIQNNTFRGLWTVSVIFGATALSKRLLILDNVIYNADTGLVNVLDAFAATTGIVARNTITSLYGTTVNSSFDWGNMTGHKNTVSGTIATRATTLVPATAST